MSDTFHRHVVGKLERQLHELRQALDQNTRLTDEQISVLQTASGKLRGFVEEPEPSRSALAELPRLLQTTLVNQVLGTAIAAPSGKFILFNSAVEHLLGPLIPAHRPAPELSDEYGFYQDDEETRYSDEELPWRRALRGEEVNGDLLYVRQPEVSDGLWLMVNCMPLIDASGDVGGAFILIFDMTERVVIERQVMELSSSLEGQIKALTDTQNNLRKLVERFHKASLGNEEPSPDGSAVSRQPANEEEISFKAGTEGLPWNTEGPPWNTEGLPWNTEGPPWNTEGPPNREGSSPPPKDPPPGMPLDRKPNRQEISPPPPPAKPPEPQAVPEPVREQSGEVEQQPSGEPGDSPDDVNSGQNLVLVVDDVPVNQKLLLMQLKKIGIGGRAAGNGAEAVEATERHDYALVLMDCEMPVMDGFAATRAIRLREKETGKHALICAMTSYDREGDRETCMAAGMDAYLPKSSTSSKLHDLVDWALKDATAPFDWSLSGAEYDNGASKETVIDVARLKEIYGKELSEIASLFLATTSTLISCMEFAIEDRDAKAMAHFAFTLKGPCSTLGLMGLTSMATKMTTASEEGQWQEAADNYRHLQKLFKEIKPQLESLVAEPAAA